QARAQAPGAAVPGAARLDRAGRSDTGVAAERRAAGAGDRRARAARAPRAADVDAALRIDRAPAPGLERGTQAPAPRPGIHRALRAPPAAAESGERGRGAPA